MALWGGRFKSEPESAMAALSRSVTFDWRLAQYDIRVNLAHLTGLVEHGFVSPGNGEIIRAGLKSLAVEIENGKFKYNEVDEDVHSAIERGLIEKIGSIGGSIRAGRSRNDLVVTDLKLYLIDNLIEVSELVGALVAALNLKAWDLIVTFAPGFTHLQHAQPVSFAHELAKHSHALLRDLDRIADWLDRNSKSPFGAGALAGSPLQPQPEAIADLLGFKGVMENSIDAVSDRDFVAEALYLAAQIGIHLSRIGEEITLWNSSEFKWITLDDRFSTGSSIMPQKKNPDAAELARGKSGRLIGNLAGFLAVTKGLAFAYNRDLQEDKEATFDSIETLSTLLPALTGMITTAIFNNEYISRQAGADYILATEIADALAKQGIAFAKAHEIAGKCVQYSEANNLQLMELSAQHLSEIDPVLSPEILRNIDVATAVNSRNSTFGTAENSVRKQLTMLDESLETARNWISNARQAFSGMMGL